MDELSKIRRVLGRLNPEAPHDVLLVLDATTGQNALAQVEVFRESAGVTGLIMTKLDGTARGGMLVAAAEKFGLPIHAIGVGEKADDLRPFDPRAVARAIAGLPAGMSTKAEPQGGARAADRPWPAAGLFPRQFLRAGPVGDEDLRRDRSVHRRDGRGDAVLGDPLPPNFTTAVVFGRSWWWSSAVSPSGCTTRSSSR